jgi:hypothetical protein
MEAHPHSFRPGPAGRRPALADGPDVWVVARVFREMAGPFEQAVQHTAELTELTPTQVGTAAKYYAEYRDEIDEWLRELDDEAERAYAAWLREQDLFGGEAAAGRNVASCDCRTVEAAWIRCRGSRRKKRPQKQAGRGNLRGRARGTTCHRDRGCERLPAIHGESPQDSGHPRWAGPYNRPRLSSQPSSTPGRLVSALDALLVSEVDLRDTERWLPSPQSGG